MDALESPVLPLFIPPLPARGRPAIRPIGRCRAFVLWAAGGGRPGRTSRTLQGGVVPRSVRSVSGGLRGTTAGSMPGTRRSASTAPGVRHVAPGEAHSSFLRTRCRMIQAAASRARIPSPTRPGMTISLRWIGTPQIEITGEAMPMATYFPGGTNTLSAAISRGPRIVVL